jgi:hypothetical protein
MSEPSLNGLGPALRDCQGYDTLDASVFNAKLWEISGDRYRNRNAQGPGCL